MLMSLVSNLEQLLEKWKIKLQVNYWLYCPLESNIYHNVVKVF